MKRILFVLSLMVSLQIGAQDVIIMRNGNTIVSKVLEVSTTEVKYKKFSNPEGPLYSVLKSELKGINYGNGDKDVFDTPSEDSNIGHDGSAPVPQQMRRTEVIINDLALKFCYLYGVELSKTRMLAIEEIYGVRQDATVTVRTTSGITRTVSVHQY